VHIKSGYSRRGVEANIREYMDYGYSEAEAKFYSKRLARKFFAKKFPDRDFPQYMRDEGHYEDTGKD
jgi:hypothetical protein